MVESGRQVTAVELPGIKPGGKKEGGWKERRQGRGEETKRRIYEQGDFASERAVIRTCVYACACFRVGGEEENKKKTNKINISYLR